MNRTVILIVVAAVSVLAATRLFRSSDDGVVQMYQVVPVTTRDIIVSASAAGTVEPIRTVEVKSKASGEIFEMHVETGDAVRAGTLLVRVDPRVPQATLRQAEADLDLAEAQLENAEAQLRRQEDLFRSQSITEQEYETARLAVASANAQLVRAQRSLEDARISAEDTDVRAPISGIIIQKNVEVGTVISSATREVGGGTILLQMANLDTVQVRALVDETDIGKIQPGLEVTITVDAYPSRPFTGRVLMIEPQASVQQNVTMFPVLVRIPNRDGLLRPGMNAEVEMHVGSRYRALAVLNAALRTDAEVSSAVEVLGLDLEQVQQQIAEARNAATNQGDSASAPGSPAGGGSARQSITTPDGRVIELPEGVTAESANAVFARVRAAGGMQNMSEADRTLMRSLFRRGEGGGQAGTGAGGGGASSTDNALMGGNYVVFVSRSGIPVAVPVRTGLTDLDYSEVLSGLSLGDSVLVLPTAGLLASQQEMQERLRGRGVLPGMQRN